MSVSIAQSIAAEHAREVAAVYQAFADELETVVLPNDPGGLHEDIKRSRETAETWRNYAEALLEEERH